MFLKYYNILMVVTLKCGNESTFFSSTTSPIEIESEATSGNIEIVNDTKVEFKNSSDTIVASVDTSSQQSLINNKSISKIHIFTESTATNQFTSMTIVNDIGHIAWITIDDNLRSGSGINNIYNQGVVSDLTLLSNNPEFWWQFRKTDVSPNIAPTIGSGNLVLTSGSFVTDVYIHS